VDNLPTWIDVDALDEFISMRNRIKKPLTPRAMVRLVNRLEALRQAGHDPNASLIQSADHYWQDCYAPKELPIERKSGVQSASGWLAEQEQARTNRAPPPASILKMVKR
jgi:hypothetical protein